MRVTDLELTWCSPFTPEDAAEVNRLLEISGIWERVRYAGSVDHHVTVITQIKDGMDCVMGDIVVSFSPSRHSFIESEVRDYITSLVLESLHGQTRNNKYPQSDACIGRRHSRRRKVQG
jgi:hypothetical protein